MADDAPAPPGGRVAGDAADIAGGSAVVLAGGIGDTGLRALTSWFLARFFGPVGYGLYAAASTWVQLLASLAPLGIDGGALYFGARFRQAEDRAALKGLVRFGFGLVAITGPFAAVGLWAVATWGTGWFADKPDLPPALRIGAVGVVAGTLLSVAVASLQAVKDMRSAALFFQLGLPGVTLAGCVVAWALGVGPLGAVVAMAAGYSVAAVLSMRAVWRHHGPLLLDASVAARLEVGRILRYSLPQSLARTLYRANMWADILMLTAMRELDEVGIYRTGVLVASFGLLPSMAITTMFNPTIAELVQTRELARLDALLKVVTRWLVLVAAPGYLVVLLLPDLCMRVFGEDYVGGSDVLGVLMIGQAVYLACSVSSAMIPMAGFANLNLVHNAAAVALNVVLNALLIPRYGMLGAATASSAALIAWSAWRVVSVWRLLGCFPFSRLTMLVVAVAVGAGALCWWLAGDSPLPVRLGATVGAVVVLVGFQATAGRTDDDAVVVERLKARLLRLVSLGRR